MFRLFITIILCWLEISLSAQTNPSVEWVDIQGGTFIMGSPESELERGKTETQHKVTLSAFKMSIFEITVEQFKMFIDATGYMTDADKSTGGFAGSEVLTNGDSKIKALVNWKCDEYGIPRKIEEYDHPVIHISWNDATAFAEWLACRLPTEAEWEYACRAGTETPFNMGNILLTTQANFCGWKSYNNSPKGECDIRTKPVGSYPPNAFGLYDMHGNVFEWCADFYGKYLKTDQTNPKGPDNGEFRVVRGGNYLCYANNCRSALRIYPLQFVRNAQIGFRLVSDLK